MFRKVWRSGSFQINYLTKIERTLSLYSTIECVVSIAWSHKILEAIKEQTLGCIIICFLQSHCQGNHFIHCPMPEYIKRRYSPILFLNLIRFKNTFTSNTFYGHNVSFFRQRSSDKTPRSSVNFLFPPFAHIAIYSKSALKL